MPTAIPLRGLYTLGPNDVQNPRLLPLMDLGVSSGSAGGTLDVMSPSRYLATYPRVDATVTCTVTGTITNLDTVKLVFTSGIFAALGGSYTTAIYTVVTADTLTTIAEQLVNIVQNDPTLQALGAEAQLTGTANPAQVVIHWNGPVGNTVTVSAVKTGTTEIYTFGNAGVMAGGSGPIIPAAAFSFSYNGVVVNFDYGKPVNVDSGMVASLVSQGRPIL